jgi:transposase
MMKLRRIIQMLSEGYSQNDICRETSSSKTTVSGYKKMAEGTKLSYQELLLMEDSELETLLQPKPADPPADPRKAELDSMMPEIVQRLSRRYATVELVHREFYLKRSPQGYGYTQFNKHVKAWREAHDLSYHNVYIRGEQWQIDFAGDSLYLTNRATGELTKVVVLVCVMPYSELPFLMALPNATSDWFFHGLNKGLEFMGALPKIAKSDNMKQWVTKADRYCPTLSDACMEWANHYHISITACRVRKPRDKGPVESAVNQLYQYVYARIQDEAFYTLDQLNARLWELLEEYIDRPYKGRTRRRIFTEDEKPCMNPLPQEMHRFRHRKTVKLGSSYHVCVGSERHMYSVPYNYVGKMVTVMWDMGYVEVFLGTMRLCVHSRSYEPYGYSTDKNHMPESHKAYERSREYNAAALIERAGFIGQSMRWVVETMLARTRFPQQAYMHCNAAIALAKEYGRDRLEHACQMMKTETSTASLKVLANILRHNRDLAGQQKEAMTALASDDDVRGEAHYARIVGRREGTNE